MPGFPAVAEGILRPAAHQNFDPFFKARLRRITIQPMLQIIARHAAPEADVEPTMRQNVEHAALFG